MRQIVVAAPSEQIVPQGATGREASHDWNALRSHAESYLNGSPWHYRLVSRKDATKLSSIWVREDEICHFDESHLICTDDIF